MKIRAVVAAIAVSVVLVSCGGTEEAAVEEQADAFSAEEIVQLVRDAERSIESMQMETDYVADDHGEHSEAHSLVIRVGEDGYENSGDEGWPWSEVLHYGGVDYYRDEDGTWNTEAGAHVYSEMMTYELEGAPPWDESLVSEAYALDFNEFRDAAVLDERTLDGRRVIGLVVESTTPVDEYLDDLESQLFPPGMEVPDDILEDFRAEIANSPDSIWQKQVVWIGVNDFLVYRVEMESKGFLDEAAVASGTMTQTYSLFNEAELPGPLP